MRMTLADALQLARSQEQAGQYGQAAAVYSQVLQADPGNREALQKLGNIFLVHDRLAEAEALFRRLLAIDPVHPEGTALLGTALLNQCRYAEAEPLLRRIVAAYPGNAIMRINLAVTLFYLGRHRESHGLMEAALREFPGVVAGHSPSLFVLSCDDGFSTGEYLAAVRRFGEAAASRARPCTQWRRPPGDPAASTLRVGFVSGDLGEHPVGYFLESVLAQVDPARVSLHAYSTWPRQDALNARLRPLFAEWREIGGLDDAAATQCIRDDGIDILVDLAGHTPRNRLGLFAWRPAPVQATWLGFFASTGVAAIDWILTDPVCVPPGETEGQFVERPWPLPHTRLCFSPPADAPAVSPLPALARGHLTFGSFQNMAKIGEPVLELWARVLAAVPGARLRLQNGELDDEEAQGAMLARLAAAGIDAGRVAMAGRMPRAEYLAAHAGVDVILDTFPFNGGTTTCEALWMGVPTLTLRGKRMLARQGESALANVGLGEWVADDPDDFVRRAVALAADVAGLSALRDGMRARLLASPLFDAQRFAGQLVDAFHGMWRASAGRLA